MKQRDFIDQDLIQHQEFNTQLDAELHEDTSGRPEASARNPGEQNPNPSVLAQHSSELNTQIMDHTAALENLRQRQLEIEKERTALEKHRQTQEKYESGKHELLERLDQYLVHMEQDEARVNQRLALLMETIASFKKMLAKAKSLDESKWSPDNAEFREELRRSLAWVEDARREFNQSIARIEATKDEKSPPLSSLSSVAIPQAQTQTDSFLRWVMIGLAASLPLIVTIIITLLVIYSTKS